MMGNSRSLDLREHLGAGKTLVADGATGTLLMAAGLPVHPRVS